MYRNGCIAFLLKTIILFFSLAFPVYILQSKEWTANNNRICHKCSCTNLYELKEYKKDISTSSHHFLRDLFEFC